MQNLKFFPILWVNTNKQKHDFGTFIVQETIQVNKISKLKLLNHFRKNVMVKKPIPKKRNLRETLYLKKFVR